MRMFLLSDIVHDDAYGGWSTTDETREGLTAVPTTTGDDIDCSWFPTEHLHGIDMALQTCDEWFRKHPVHFGGI